MTEQTESPGQVKAFTLIGFRAPVVYMLKVYYSTIGILIGKGIKGEIRGYKPLIYMSLCNAWNTSRKNNLSFSSFCCSATCIQSQHDPYANDTVQYH